MLLKSRVTSPTNAGSVSDTNSASKGVISSEKSTWAPLVMFLGPCYAVKKVQFGRPVEHIDFRDVPRLYETIPLETALQVWSNTAHEGILRGLKHYNTYGISMLDRLVSDTCSEMRMCALYFSQQITKKEFKEGMRTLISDDFVYTAFLIALRRMRTDKKITKMSTTLQIYQPEAQSQVTTESVTRLKWAVKYNPEVISFDEGNLQVQTGVYDCMDAFALACKYQRKVRIARWGEEIPDVPLCELLFLSLVDFLHTGRYIDCEYTARSHALAQTQHRNALGLVATPEDVAFNFGYVLDKEGFVTKFLKPATPVRARFSFVDLFRPAKRPESGASPSRKSSFVLPGSTRSMRNTELSEEHKLIEKQIQTELGVEQPELVSPTLSIEVSDFAGGGSDDGEWAETTVAAVRNARKVRTETNWVAFLNHTVPSSAAPYSYSNKNKGKGKSHLSSRRGSFRTSSAPEGEQPVSPVSPHTPTSPAHDLQAELGSYSYGLGDKKPYKPAQSSAADAAALSKSRVVWRDPSATGTGIAKVPSVKLSEANLERNHSFHVEAATKQELKEMLALETVAAVRPTPTPVAVTAVPPVAPIRQKVAKKDASVSPTTITPPTQTEKRVETHSAASVTTAPVVSRNTPTLPVPVAQQARAPLTIKIPSDVSFISINTTPVDTTSPPDVLSGTSGSAVVPVPVSVPVSASPRFSPRARLSHSPTEEVFRESLIVTDSDITISTTGTGAVDEESADMALTAALKKAQLFKAVDVQKLHSPTSTSVTTPNTTDTTTSTTSTSAVPLVKVHRIVTPTAVQQSRPVLRPPSAMDVRKIPEIPRQAPPLPTTAPVAPEETRETPSTQPETAHPPSVPEAVVLKEVHRGVQKEGPILQEAAPVEAVTVREKTDVIEGRLRSRVVSPRTPSVHRAVTPNSSALSTAQTVPDTVNLDLPNTIEVSDTSDVCEVKPDPIVVTVSEPKSVPEPVKKAEPLTQKKLQQKWAFNTIMRNQTAHN